MGTSADVEQLALVTVGDGQQQISVEQLAHSAVGDGAKRISVIAGALLTVGNGPGIVRETKGTNNKSDLRSTEEMKIECGFAHFKELKVDFDWVAKAEDV